MEFMRNIRNFSIIAHIDHGKSTLSDRMLEKTKTVEDRKMQDQVLDSMELERERGITIKMQPVRMEYETGGEQYIFNLIDTPGHIDFSYEVSRALEAVEGSILLVDATKGVQAQTLSTLRTARALGNVIVPVVSKVDSPLAQTTEVKMEIAELLECEIDEVLEVSGKTGEGVDALLEYLAHNIPEPRSGSEKFKEDGESSEKGERDGFRALVFDFEYSNHRGIVLFVRVFDGSAARGKNLSLAQVEQRFGSGEVGIFHPDQTPVEQLRAGEIGYIVTGVKEPGVAKVGDTVVDFKNPLPAFGGYRDPVPMVWASIYPESQDDFSALYQALLRLRLSDSSLSFEEEGSGALGRGFRCGFLGMLHLEVITERLRREFGLDFITASPSTAYELQYSSGQTEMVYSPSFFPDHGSFERVWEPWVKAKIFTPSDYLGEVLGVFHEHEAQAGETDTFGEDSAAIEVKLPLRELMRGFFDELKSVTSGYASVSYENAGMHEADVARMDILVAEEPVAAFSKVVSGVRLETEARESVERLHEVLPRQLFEVKIQARARGKIIASKKLPAMRKDVTAKLYGGDVTRKKKLLENQKKNKKEMGGSVNIPPSVFLKMMK